MLVNTPSRQVKSVRTVFDLIGKLQTLGGATPSQLTEELDLSRSSVHNYLATLETEGYVVNEGGTYRLGLRFLTHGMAAKNMMDFERPIVQTIQSVAEQLSRPTWWVVEESGRGYFMQCAIPNDSTLSYGNVGNRSHLHTHALGKAILAISTNEYIERVADHHGLPEQTQRTTTDLDVLLEELETARSRGFAISEGEAVLGILSVGVGFRDTDDRRHAIGVFGDSRSFAGNHAGNIGQQLVDAIGDLEQRPQNGGM